MLQEVINTIFPRRCPFCGKVIGTKYICDKCKSTLPYVKGPTCVVCGKVIDSYEDAECMDCQRLKKSFNKGFPVFNYEDPLVLSLYSFKYNNKREYSDYFADEIVKKHGNTFKNLGIDVIIPIPIHKGRLRKRGYNQATLLAQKISLLINIPMDEDLLIRVGKTSAQKNLDDSERIKNLLKAFKCNDNKFEYKSVLLVDDIYTTGATIEACTNLLRSRGIENVYYTSVCIGKGM